ncbi:MAG: N-6 DNA methylase [Myxococcota bacterium]
MLLAPLDLADPDLKDILLETPVGDRRRIDIETGSTVIEVKKDLRPAKIREDAVEQLRGYVEARQAETGRRFVGVLSDGVEWRCYHLGLSGLEEVAGFSLKGTDADGLLLWLEGVMATTQHISPTPREIRLRLGAGTSSHALDRATLTSLYKASKEIESVRLKRKLWARLLTTALGTQFEDRDDLFVEHTLLVNSAEIIAHAVLGLPLETITPAALLTGSKFDESGVYGVVESDFFDWVIEVPGGETFVRTLARRLGRFEWSDVEHDVLKVLYESVIAQETRKKLGEYYTPDWLAEAMVAETIEDPLNARVLDPACGSGTFLFHAVRRFIKAAETNGLSLKELFEGVTRSVVGLDLHPVAVTLARVTYLLAIGRERLAAPGRPTIQIPIYLGDSVQWQQKEISLFTHGNLVVETSDGAELFSTELRFPDKLLEDARVFDELIEDLATKASKRKRGTPVPSLSGVFQRLGIPQEWRETLIASFKTLCRLHDEGRDHIWSYYIRNLARPRWLERQGNRVDVLIGNPPWLAYRNMTEEMQRSFRKMSMSRHLWHGAKVATHQDLSGLFVARCVQQYLRQGGRFAFVMPNAVIDRGQFAGFRQAAYSDTAEPVNVQFGEAWDLRRIRPHFFPRGAAVVFGTKAAAPVALSREIELWSGRLPGPNLSWSEAKPHLERKSGHAVVSGGAKGSPYADRFSQGASLVPRMLLCVEEMPASPLGVPHGRRSIRSTRSAYEKKPWKDLAALEGIVESEFIRPLYLGETVLPYRLLSSGMAVIPWDGLELCHGESERLELYPGLAGWWRQAEQVWLAHRSSERLTLVDQVNFRQKLSNQFPIQPRRIVYSKAGMHLAAAVVTDPRGIIDHKLYWGVAATEAEADFVCAILNSAAVTQLVRPLMSYGKDERDIDKHVWELPIPEFDASDSDHAEISKLGATARAEVLALELDESKHFAALRRTVREHLASSPTGQAIEQLVVELLA